MKTFSERILITIITIATLVTVFIPVATEAANSAGGYVFNSNDGLRIDGSPEVYPILAAAAGIQGAGGISSNGPFQSSNPPIQVEIQQGGSTVGKTDAENQAVDLGAALNITDLGKYPNLTAVKIARESISIIINSTYNTLFDITPNQLKAIYSAYYAVGWNGQGTPTNIQLNDGSNGTPGINTDWQGRPLGQPLAPIIYWNQVRSDLPHQPIMVCAMNTDTGTQNSFADFLHLDTINSEAATVFMSGNLPFASNNDLNAAVNSIPFSIGYMESGLAINNNPGYYLNCIPLTVNGQKATVQNVTTGAYPFSSYLYLVENNNPNDSTVLNNRTNAWDFMSYLLSPAGQNIVEQCGFVRLIPRADVNQDGCINIMDMAMVNLKMGLTGPAGWIPEDVNQDGIVDIKDLYQVYSWFGIVYGSANNPTPDYTYTAPNTNPVIHLTSSCNPCGSGESLVLTASLTPGPAGGTVQFQDNGKNLGDAVQVIQGRASLITTNLALGSHNIIATYSGDPGFNAAPGTLTQTIIDQASDNCISLSTASQVISAGQIIDVDVLLNNTAAINTWQADINFDPAKLTCDHIKDGIYLSSDVNTMFPDLYFDNTKGVVNIACGLTQQAGFSGSGQLYTIRFTVNNGFTGTTDISINNPIFLDTNGNSITGFIANNLTLTAENQPPAIDSFTPSMGTPGSLITINGSHFTPGSTVSFGGVAAKNVYFISGSQLSALVGTGASGPVGITTPLGTATSGAVFNFSNPLSGPPSITSFSPAMGGPGTPVIINGTGFSGATAVSFGSIPAQTYIVNSDSQITAILGNGASGSLSVVTPSGTATDNGFTYVSSNPNPILSISPANPVEGQGSNFTVSLAVETSTLIGGWQSDISFDASSLQCAGITYGNFLTSYAQANGLAAGSQSSPVIDNTNGKITSLGSTLGRVGNGASGSGILCTLNFTVVAANSSDALITPVNYVLEDPNGASIANVTANKGDVSLVDYTTLATADLSYNISDTGSLTQPVTVQATNNQALIQIDDGTQAETSEGVPLNQITLEPEVTTPAPNPLAIGTTYALGPSGAVFYQPVVLTLKYDPATLAAGEDENNLYVAWYDTNSNKWVALDSTVDTVNKTVSVQINHFSEYSLSYSNIVNPSIIVSSGSGGSITPSGSVAVNSGTNQSFSIAANTGYHVTSVLVDGNSVGSVYSYTFNNVTANHTISASFVPNATIPAWDVNEDHVGDITDIQEIGNYYGQVHPADPRADVLHDGIVDISDIQEVGNHYGEIWSVADYIKDYTFYNNSNLFSRSSTPVNVVNGNFTQSQSITENGMINLTIANAPGYDDCGFYVYAGQLKNLNGVIVQAVNGSSPFGLNIWFDKDGDGEYFNWNGNVLSNLGNDAYILGPSSQNNALTIDSNSQFTSLQPGGGNYTLAQLKNGAVSGITGDTTIAIWVGITAGSGGSLNTTISSVTIQ